LSGRKKWWPRCRRWNRVTPTTTAPSPTPTVLSSACTAPWDSRPRSCYTITTFLSSRPPPCLARVYVPARNCSPDPNRRRETKDDLIRKGWFCRRSKVYHDDCQPFVSLREIPTMNPIEFALRRPYTIMVAMVALIAGGGLAVTRTQVDIFPALDLPVIYVAQPYGGMDPSQMEGLIAYYYEYHFLYIGGIHHVESRNVQGVALMKLFFHPDTNMAQAMAETVQYVNRSRAFMPPGTVGPFVMRFDTGSVPVGYLVLKSDTKTIGEIQDQALNRVRPMFARIPGVSAPPPFGGNQKTVVLQVDPERLRSYNASPDDVVAA